MTDDAHKRADRIATLFFRRGTPENKQLAEMIARELRILAMEIRTEVKNGTGTVAGNA